MEGRKVVSTPRMVRNGAIFSVDSLEKYGIQFCSFLSGKYYLSKG
jgi:hypothetical protein